MLCGAIINVIVRSKLYTVVAQNNAFVTNQRSGILVMVVPIHERFSSESMSRIPGPYELTLSTASLRLPVNDLGEVACVNQFYAMRAYFSFVVLDKASDKIVGHIAVDKSQQGKKLGLRIIQALPHISEGSGCHKTILTVVRPIFPSIKNVTM
ncbi:hypothetical protein BDR03DRAFT_1000511 [Suillus americanus]|nr:hypothetical protein BDR03DRAFT_1000511 [Suillus americanus]